MSANSLPAFAQNIQPTIKRFSVDTLVVPRSTADDVRHTDKVDSAYKASQWYLGIATAADMTTTIIGLNSAHGVETGWARCFGSRNTTAIVAGNVAKNLGVGYLSRRMRQKGGRWKWAATAFNVANATMNAEASFHNVRYIAKH